MYTVCPKCTLTLAVTAADLRIGQGYVRCGRCLNVFNALLALSEEPSDTLGAAPQADRASSSQITAALAGMAAEQQGASSAQASPADGPPNQLPTESSSDGSIENESSVADGTGTFETIVLEGEGITQTEEFVPGESVDSEIASLTQRLGAAANEPIGKPVHWRDEGFEPTSDFSDVAEDLLSEEAPAAEARTRGFADPDPLDEPVDALLEDTDEEEFEEHAIEVDEAGADEAASELVKLGGPAHRRWPWLLGCVAMLLLLALQLANHERDALAASPFWNGSVTRLYGALKVPLDPHWNLAAYDIRQQGAAADARDDHIVHVRLSLANKAARAQPVPLLRLTLLDRYGKPIASRDLVPSEYWPAGEAPRSFLARDERIDSQVAVRDPNADSSSFELDVCLKDPRGQVQCASDLPGASSSPKP